MRIDKVIGKGGDEIVSVRMGYSELLMLYELARDAYKKFPKHFETSPARNRLHMMQKMMAQVIDPWRQSKPGYRPEEFVKHRVHE